MKRLTNKQKVLACDLLVRRGTQDGVTPWQVYQSGVSFIINGELILINFTGNSFRIQQRCVETNTLIKFSFVDSDLKDKLINLINETADQARQIDPEFGKATKKKKAEPIYGVMALFARHAHDDQEARQKREEAKQKHEAMMDNVYNQLFTASR